MDVLNISVTQRPTVRISCPKFIANDVPYKCTCDVTGNRLSSLIVRRDSTDTTIPIADGKYERKVLNARQKSQYEIVKMPKKSE